MFSHFTFFDDLISYFLPFFCTTPFFRYFFITKYLLYRPELVRPGALMGSQNVTTVVSSASGNVVNNSNIGMATSVIRISPNPPASVASSNNNGSNLMAPSAQLIAWRNGTNTVTSVGNESPHPSMSPSPNVSSTSSVTSAPVTLYEQQPSVVVTSHPQSIILQQALTNVEVCLINGNFIY